MKKFNKIVSLLLAVLMLLGAFSITTFAAEADDKPVYEYNTTRQTLDYLSGQVLAYDEKGKQILDGNGKPTTVTNEETGSPIVIDTAAKRLEYMDLRLEKDGYRFYVDAYSGEVAVENIRTGQTMFSNPYDAGSTTSVDTIKAQLLSQIVVKYEDLSQNNAESIFYSYTEAAQRGQIDIKNIKNGIRVEYSIGREQAKMLVPMMIEKSSFEKNIYEPMVEAMGEDSWELAKFMSFYIYQGKDRYEGDALQAALKKYPILKNMDFYIIDDAASEVDRARMEQNIKTYAPDYTFDDLDEDHLLVGYESEDENPPLFRMALEYTLSEEGLSVRLPANGIRFNETLYRLTNIEILPYMGAAANPGAGYTFFPDGSGTLFDFEKIQETGATTTVTNKVYGQDFAYHTITGKHQEEIRYPVYGVVDTYDVIKETGEEYSAADYAKVKAEELPELTQKQRGFVAIVEEGDAMMEITTYHEVRSHKYNTVKVSVFPRPKDTYNVKDAISVGSNSDWTVVSSRKYTGSYRIKYVMLTPDDVAEEAGLEKSYECSYVGMAFAYRDYLINKGVLTKLTADDVKEDIPLYIETFGTIPTTEKILSVPVTVMTPLTSFEDIATMYDNLSSHGITNINFIMTGYNDKGMYSGVDYDVKWERAVGGKKGFEELVAYAKENGFGVYPDFDFVYHTGNTLTDGVTIKKHLVKTIDDRYANKQEYSATKQSYLSFFELLISPAYMDRFYQHLTDEYMKYDPIGISISTLGNSLNSDFDEDEPYNREDSKFFTVEALAYLDEKYDSIITSEGNAFTWKYVDHITDIALDSSRYSQAGASVPFLGIVLHGYVQTAGSPINMEGNIDYALLKAIENGASIKFILSYRNTNKLKNTGNDKTQKDLSTYYSIRYDIWFDDVVSIYTELNSLLADVQTASISDHKFVEGVRVPDADELISDAQALMAELAAQEQAMLDTANDATRVKLLKARLAILNNYYAKDAAIDEIKSFDTKLYSYESVNSDGTSSIIDRVEQLNAFIEVYNTNYAELQALKAELEELQKDEEGNATAITAKNKEITSKNRDVTKATDNIRKLVNEAYSHTNNIVKKVDALEILVKEARESYEILAEDATTRAELLEELKTLVEEYEAMFAEVEPLRAAAVEYCQETLFDIFGDVVTTLQKYEVPVVEEIVEEEVVVEESTNKYASDDNKITYVEYENGVAFLLNFNNYAVRTEFNGTVYTISAYDYLVIGSAN